ncbi:Bug family tripartite tricarboxylate transporter substrate binding protein [Salibacterium halotolerans]|uniref:Tripartite-type tricarboxylate transporter, receptor component TctC n=1 Tax=Salibacterium halotolerans TaxID=1884432 RepID=A0A1I5LCQ2_9BACI|nr:tripartite tricarboxylate transporter substrate binding protein [Salibacterium halotolerans]SFO95028.1 Tripartite-type tricarboxylate transporter, receptor component TctC [Salibacterium halotolerans]
MKRAVTLTTLAAAVMTITGCGTGGSAENYPSEPITYSIPFGPGGQSDVEARRQEPMLEEILDTEVNITYKEGAGGAVGWTELVSEQGDGYFISGMNIPHIILQPMTQDDAGYETDQINPVAIFQGTPIGLAVPADSDIETLDDFIEQAETGEQMTISGSGTYSGHHLAFMQLSNLKDLDMEYVPSTGAAESIQNFLGGNTDAIFANSNDLVKYKEDMNILAIGAEETFEALPDVPTFQEEGADFTASIDRGVAVPPDTDEEIIQTLEDAFLEIANDESVQEEMVNEGFEPVSMGREETQEHIDELKSEYEETMRELGEIE